jgi:hypothetical protein
MDVSNEGATMTKEQKKKSVRVAANKTAQEILALQFKGKKLSQRTVREVADKMARTIPVSL